MKFLYDKFRDLTSEIEPLPIHVVNLPLLVNKNGIAEKFDIAQDCITLKRKPGKNSASAIIVPPSWLKSDFILEGKVFFGKREAFVWQSFDLDPSRPSSKHYKPHKLPSEEFDLSPACNGQPTLHVLNDDILLHIFKYLNVSEKLMLEAVCRRFQSLVYRELGQKSFIDFTYDYDDCVWQSAHRNLLECRSKSPAQLTQDIKLCTYKMLIMNASHLTTLRLDEYFCSLDVNVFDAIGRLAVNLEDLCLSFRPQRIRPYIPMKTIFSRCTKLRTLCFEGTFRTGKLLRELKKCKSLEVLRLGRMIDLTNNWGLLWQLKTPLKELSIHNIQSLCSLGSTENYTDSPFKSCLTTLRIFDNTQPIKKWCRCQGGGRCDSVIYETLSSMARSCPALAQLQLDFSCYNVSLNFKIFKNLKVLHFIASDDDNIEVLLKSALPDLEDLYIEFSTKKVYEMHTRNEVLAIDFSLAPTSVTSLTLPSVALDDNSYKSLLRMPKLRRVFAKSKKFSMAQLELLVAHVQLVEIGAAMVSVDLSAAQELAKLRWKALADERRSLPSRSLDNDEPLVLHVDYAHHVAFADPFIKIKDHKLESYIYEVVGSSRFDIDWLDFGRDLLQQKRRHKCLDIDRELLVFETYEDSDDPDNIAGLYDEPLDEDI
ncbi:uncharacterized protein LOC108667945 isoform X2 [Hyalella azteca]|uniref:Uncharacterized protein LOC108667945 isoform X2 n=1 Tax=Hyalella azteca TaxID=294128 RepID=A0A979FVF9_HYAAZ|nr:uncharacterized protein LOC108667945 isoform X2 [Hyalella azteca]